MFDDLSVEIARSICLITGAKLVYGGDLRIGGFTKLLCDLSCQYGIKEKSDPSTIYFTNYLLGLYLIGSQNLTSLNLNTTVWK